MSFYTNKTWKCFPTHILPAYYFVYIYPHKKRIRHELYISLSNYIKDDFTNKQLNKYSIIYSYHSSLNFTESTQLLFTSNSLEETTNKLQDLIVNFESLNPEVIVAQNLLKGF